MSTPRLLRLTLLPAVLLLWTASTAFAAVEPNRESGFMGQLVARILEQSHYMSRPIDDAVSSQTLRNYIDSYDYNHLIFEKDDIERFESRFADSLDERIRQGDLQPAFDIFNLYVERLTQRLELVKKLAAEKHDFTIDESVQLDRHEAPWPATPAEVENLWRLRIKHEILQERLNKATAEDQIKTVVLRYERLLRSVKEYDANDVLQSYLTSMTHAFDPHSDYLAAPQKENFDISMRLSLVGIGAVLRSEDGYAKIVNLVPGGPADVDKRLKPNDRIEAVAQGDSEFLEVVGMKLDRLVQMIRGEKGTKVRLRIIPVDAADPATRVEIALIRDEIKLTDQEAKARVFELPMNGRPTKIGVIDLPSFYSDLKSGGEAKSTTRDVTKLLGELKRQGIEGLVFDLRRNGGGSLSEAVSLTGLFIREGPVVGIKDAKGGLRVLRDTDPEIAYEGPLVVLTSRMSASASEIFAGAIQDYQRGLIVGESSTFGKGTVQSMLDLSQYLPGAYKDARPGALKLTIQKFYRVSGASTQNKGVLPDIHLPSISDHMDVTESSIKNAVPYDEIPTLGYEKLDRSSAGLSSLKAASASRTASSREFDYIREDIARYDVESKNKIISLNEKTRLSEKEQNKSRDELRKKDRLARKTPQNVSVDVTLQSIDGIPSPAPAAVSTVTASGEDYEKAPPAPDSPLDESLNILKDMILDARKNPQYQYPITRAPLPSAVPAANHPPTESAAAPNPTPIKKEDLRQMIAEALAAAAPPAAKAPSSARLSDVDAPGYKLPVRPNDFALVIGIEKYSDLPDARFAEHDASSVVSHLLALGYPRRNIIHLAGNKAGRAALEKYLEDWLPRNVKEDSRVFFYFSGHGAPDIHSGLAYLVPWDGDASFLDRTAYPIKRLYEKLGALKAKEVLVAIDACFSGAGGRSVLPKGARPLVTLADMGTPPPGKILSFSAASSKEITSTLEEQSHGIFTYFFLKGLSGAAKDSSGAVTAKGLYRYLKPLVEDEAQRQNRSQTPRLDGGWGNEGVIRAR